MNTTIKTNAILGFIFTFLMVGLLNMPIQAQSTDKNRPTPITSRVMSGTVYGKQTHYYSVRAGRSNTITVNAKVSFINGGSFSLDFRGFPGRDGGEKRCCEGDSYIFMDTGKREAGEFEKSFTALSDDHFYMIFNFNIPRGTMAYTIKFDGIELDGEEIDSDEGDSETVIVSGKSGNNWINTGIKVQRGDTVILRATGKVDVGAGWGIHDATGTGKFAERSNYPVNSRTRYGLAAKIVPTRGATIQKWGYGDSRSMYITKNGTLYLTVNDDAPDDNSGKFEVKVTIRRGR